jgi:hypothetical protein
MTLAGSPGVKYRIVKIMKAVANRVTTIHRQRLKMYFAIRELPLHQRGTCRRGPWFYPRTAAAVEGPDSF